MRDNNQLDIKYTQRSLQMKQNAEKVSKHETLLNEYKEAFEDIENGQKQVD